jgi:hypothetical protein
MIPFLSFSQWTQKGNDVNGESAGDRFGFSVSLSSDGNIMAIAAARNNSGTTPPPDYVRIYQNVSGTWTQIGDDIEEEGEYVQRGTVVSLSSDGSVVAIGARGNDGNGFGSGHVRIFQNISGTWTQIGSDIDSESPADQSGWSVSLSSDGSITAIGAVGNDENGSGSGHVRVYENVSNTWTQVGSDIDGEVAGDLSGFSVSLSSNGSILAIGANRNNGNGTLSGHVRVYQNVSGTWIQIGSDIDGEAAGDQSGQSVSLSSDGSILAIGALVNDGNGDNSGHVRVYQNVSGTWMQIGSDIDGEAAGDFFGGSVCLSSDGNILAIGANRNDENGTDSGHVRVYQNMSGTWTQIGNNIIGEAAGDFFGGSVSLSSDGNIVTIGAIRNSENGINSGQVRVFENMSVLDVGDYSFKDIIIFYPNPVKDELYIRSEEKLEKIEIYNHIGQKVLDNNKVMINLSELSSGVYFLKVYSETGKTGIKRFIKE